MSFTMEKMIGGTTFRYSKIRGVPKSVNAQMKTMREPARYPGNIRGAVTVLKRWNPLDPMFSACSSNVGSIFASEAERFR